MKIRLPAAIIFCGLSAAVNPAFGQIWTLTSAPSNSPVFIASSADGSKLAAVDSQIYTSTNYGVTWTTNNLPSVEWVSIASSADGCKLAAVAFGGGIYTTTNSGGAWTQTIATNNNWQRITSSADGCVLVAAGGASIYISTNSGGCWAQTTATPPTNFLWKSVAASADGCKLVAAAWYPNEPINGIYTSTNTGGTWAQTRAPSNVWVSVASSADGSRLVAAADLSINPTNFLILTSSSVWTSTNSGDTWISNNVPFAGGAWASVASSADGVNLVAAPSFLGPFICISTNSGTTWNSNSVPSVGWWDSVASSADGNKLVAGAEPGDPGSFGGIYTWQTTPAPQLNLAASSTNLFLSWIVPSTNFVLQQSPDLISWEDVTNTTTLNLTNLQNQITLLPANSSFFRLISQ